METKFFDTHAHYDDRAFDSDRDELLANLPKNGVPLVLNPGCDKKTSLAAIRLAEKYPHVYAAAGWHPHDAKRFPEDGESLLEAWSKNPKVVAIGEIGLDFYRDISPRDVQRSVFIRQLETALRVNLPVIIHDRDAHGECMEIIERYPALRGVFHCYSGSAEMAERLVKMGWYLSFTGAVTFRNARRALEAAAAVPMDRIMLETDCPYLAPEPYRGSRCDSTLLGYTAAAIAEVKCVSVSELALAAYNNGVRFFSIGQKSGGAL